MTEAFERFILQHADAIARGILSKVSATYQLDPGPDADRAKRLRRRLYPAQLHCAAAIARRLRTHRDALLTGEPSTGKTVASIAVAWMLRASKVLAVVPAHLIGKWRREILQTLPDAEVVELRRISDAQAAATATSCTPQRPLWALVSRDIAKLDAHWAPAAHPRWAIRPRTPLRPGVDLPKTARVGRMEDICPSIEIDLESGQPIMAFRCPDCYQPLGEWHKEDKMWTWRWWTAAYLEAAIRKCPHCNAVLARRHSRGSGGAFPIARYLARYHPGAFDLAVVDEVHRHKGGDTAQGIALTWVGQAAKRVVGLTATLTSGKPASVFHLLHRLSREFRVEWQHSDAAVFAREYGLVRRIWGQDTEGLTAGRRSARKEKVRPRTQELPGLSPAILRHVLDRTAFIRLADLRAHLPPFDEQAVAVEMTAEQRAGHARLLAELRVALHSDLRHRRSAALAAKLHLLLTWPDTPWRPLWEIVHQDGAPALAPLAEEAVYPKETVVIDTCRKEAANGRRTLVYCVHTGESGAADRITRLLGEAGLRVAWLEANVAPRAREDWIERRAPDLDVLVSSPRLVGEGLDLLQFPTIIWVEPEYNVYTVRQASRRSWRLGQTQAVRVRHLYYAESAQEHAARLVARGVVAAAALDGDVAEAAAGLGALAGTETVYELARLVLGEVEIGRPGATASVLETAFRQANDTEAQVATAIDGTSLVGGWTLENAARQRRRTQESVANTRQTSLF